MPKTAVPVERAHSCTCLLLFAAVALATPPAKRVCGLVQQAWPT